jgi:hypothetical protein
VCYAHCMNKISPGDLLNIHYKNSIITAISVYSDLNSNKIAGQLLPGDIVIFVEFSKHENCYAYIISKLGLCYIHTYFLVH